MADMAALYPPYVKEQLLRQEKGDEARRPGALQGSQYLSLATRHATSKWHHSRGPPPLARAELDTVGVIFRCFVAYLPLGRIEGPLPSTANHDGRRIMTKLGRRFEWHMERTEGRGPAWATLPDFTRGMWTFWFDKLSNSDHRCTLPGPDRRNTDDGYRLNDMEWQGFWITQKELNAAVCEAVVMYSLARGVQYD